MFTSDFTSSSVPWNVFGEGRRSCAGQHLVLPFLEQLRGELLGCPRFRPELNHRYSGRNNDSPASFSEMFYFVKTIMPVIVSRHRSA